MIRRQKKFDEEDSMNLYKLVHITVLGLAVAFTYADDIKARQVMADTLPTGCAASAPIDSVLAPSDLTGLFASRDASRDARPDASTGDPLPLAPGCEDCELVDWLQEIYCELRPGFDCDGFWGWEESYHWQRIKFLFRCFDGETYSWHVTCQTWRPWSTDPCCNNGQEGPPDDNDCTWPGAEVCPVETPK